MRFAFHFSQDAETNQLTALLVPETEGEGLEARKKGDRFDALKERFGFMASFQIVIRDAGAEMVNMVKTNVPREPLEHFGKLVKRTPFQGGAFVVPFVAALPIDAFKLVLDVKKPNPGRSARYSDDQLNQ